MNLLQVHGGGAQRDPDQTKASRRATLLMRTGEGFTGRSVAESDRRAPGWVWSEERSRDGRKVASATGQREAGRAGLV